MTREIKLTLPTPPSANTYWRHGKNGVHLSEQALNYRETVGWACLQAQIEPFEPDVLLSMHIDCYGLHARRDLGNCEKQLSDSLQQYCFADDVQLVDIHLRRMVKKGVKVADGYVVVTIRETEPIVEGQS